VGTGTGLSGVQLLVVTVKLLKDPKQLLLLPITAWLGVGQVFRGSDFTIVSTGAWKSFTSHISIAAIHLTFIWEVPSMNLVWVVNYHDPCFHGFLSASWCMPWNRPLSTTFLFSVFCTVISYISDICLSFVPYSFKNLLFWALYGISIPHFIK
jgi:hypothetical protein